MSPVLLPVLACLVSLSSLVSTSAFFTDCSSFSTCSTCTDATSLLKGDWKFDRLLDLSLLPCEWCPSSGSCHKSGVFGLFEGCVGETGVSFRDQCPYDSYPLSPISFLPDWQGSVFPLIKDLAFLDLSLPGTHDSLSADLSTELSVTCVEDYPHLDAILHEYSGGGKINLIPRQVEDFIRQQGKTQQLSITQQLDNGVRFVDFRMMMEPDEQEWYSLHCMQSSRKALDYFQDIRDWLDLHPTEFVALWLSKHGDQGATGSDAYPGVSVAAKQSFWSEISAVFDGLLLDTRVSILSETRVEDLLARGHRVVVFASDYEEFTASSPFASNSWLIDNQTGEGITAAEASLLEERSAFQSAKAYKAGDKTWGGFYLRSLATSTPSAQATLAAVLKFDPLADYDKVTADCVATFDDPLLGWCPEGLEDIGTLTSYYKQLSLEEAFLRAKNGEGWEMPNAIYLDALDVDGTIRTGDTLMNGLLRSGGTNGNAKYAYADTMIWFTVKKGCERDGADGELCKKTMDMIEARRDKYPVELWSDALYGRSTNWPESPFSF